MEADRLARERARIDEIDERLLDLLRQRAEIVDEVARAKRLAGEERRSAFRPEREAAVLRRLRRRVQEEGGPSFEGVARVWREIMAAALLQQEPVTVGLPAAAKGDAQELRALARNHFGGGAKLTEHGDMTRLYRAVERDPALLGVTPNLGTYAEAAAAGDGEGCRIFAALPFWGAVRPQAYAFGHVSLAATGDDVSVLWCGEETVEGQEAMPAVPAAGGLVVSLAAFIDPASLPASARLLGCYARPLDMELP